MRDFSGVIPFGTIPNVTVVHPGRGFKTVQDLVAAAKKSGQFTYGSAGVGSATHWAAERLRLSGGYEATHVPFKGGPEALTEVMAGRVDFTCMGISAALPLIRDGKLVGAGGELRGALGGAAERADDARSRPEGLRLQLLAGPVRAVEDAARDRRRLYAETQKALATPAVQDKFKPQGIEPLKMTSAEFDAMVKREVASNIALVNAAKLKFN